MAGQRPTRVNETLERVLQRYDPHRRMKAYKVWTFWADEVGKSVAAHAEPAGFREGVLSVRVDSPTWMQELQFQKESMRDRLNQRLGEPLIRDIYFVSGGKIQKAPEKQEIVRTAPKAKPAAMPRIRDAELADVFGRLAQAQAKNRRRD